MNDKTAPGKEVGSALSLRDYVTSEQIMAACLANQDTNHFIARYTGVASGLRPYVNAFKRTDADEDKKFGLTGDFRSTGFNNEVFEGNIWYPPANLQTMLENALSTGDHGADVKVGYDIYARYDAKSATKYRFAIFDILNEENPTLAAIEEQLKDIPLPASAMPVQAISDGTKKK